MSNDPTSSMPHPIDSTMHGMTDYTVGTMMMTALPRMAGVEGTPAGRQIRAAGAAHVAYSTMTDYPLGAVKVIPYRMHLTIDALGAIALAAVPFITGQYRRGRRQWLPQVGLALFEIASLALSDPTGRGDYKADVGAVRAANMADPEAAVFTPEPAARPGSSTPGSSPVDSPVSRAPAV